MTRILLFILVGSSNKYDTSEIRHYLNGTETFNNIGFLQKAFTQVAINKIENTSVDNSEQSTFGTGETPSTNQYACGNTTDKIFLLSEKEVTIAEYGFGAYNAQDAARLRKPTDYAKATGISVDSTYSICWWWLRSPHFSNSDSARNVYSNGDALHSNVVSGTYRGVVPVLSISFQ